MPSTGLNTGPYGLTSANINGALRYTAPGAYALGYLNQQNTFVVQYVGRSDDDLNGRLQQHAGLGKYSAFKADYTVSAQAAFERECRMFHDFGGDRLLDNKVHPARPAGRMFKCPACTIFG
jgi:hypothetical protein